MKTKTTTPSARPKFKGFDYEDGRIVKTAYLNGYSFGERQLEGMMFKVTVQDDGTLKVEVCDESKDYLKTLNEKMWLKRALEFAEQNDIFSEKEDGGEDLVLLPA